MTLTIHPEAEIAADVQLGPNAVIGRAVIEPGVVIGANVVVYDHVRIGQGTRVFDNVVLGRLPQVAGIIQRQPRVDLPWLEIGAGCVIGVGTVLYLGSIFGASTLIGDLTCVREECRIGSNVVIGRSVLLNYNIEVHDRVRIMDGCHFGGDMTIESDVFIGPFLSSANDNLMGLQQTSERKGAYIRRGASLGVSVILLAGVEIGEQAMIGAGALVNSDIPARTIALGQPARVIKDVPPELLRPLHPTV